MKSLPIILAAALTTGACATTPAPAPLEPECDIAAIGDLVGKPATSQLAADALKRSGARTVRWKAPGLPMTMDYRVDRLNISIDGNSVVTGFDCG